MNNVTYTKVFHKIINSSIWDEDNETRIVWLTLLMMADRDGNVASTMKGLAVWARVPLEAAQKAIEKFLGPDVNSSTKENDGRRITIVDGGWHLINHAKYTNMMSAEYRKDYFRRKQAEYRDKKKQTQSGMTARQIISEQVDVKDQLEKDGVL